MRLRHLAALALPLLACGRTADRQAATERAADTAATAPGPSTPAPGTGGSAGGIPAEVLVRRNACPFECCVYRDWTAETAIPVVSTPRSAAAPAFTIPKGQTFRADSGNLYVTGIARIAVTDTVPLGQGRPPLLPGDTIVLLDHVGEGYWNVFHRGAVLREVPGFWDSEAPNTSGIRLGRYAKQWWVHVTAPDRRQGWFRADTTYRFKGADRCA